MNPTEANVQPPIHSSHKAWIVAASFVAAAALLAFYVLDTPSSRAGFPVTAHMHQACATAFGDQGPTAVADCEDRLALRAASRDDLARQQIAAAAAADADANGSPAYQAYVRGVSAQCGKAKSYVSCVTDIMTADEAAGRVPPR